MNATRSSEQKTQSPSNPSDSEVPHLTDLKVSYLTDSLDQRTFIGTLYDLVKAEKRTSYSRRSLLCYETKR